MEDDLRKKNEDDLQKKDYLQKKNGKKMKTTSKKLEKWRRPQKKWEKNEDNLKKNDKQAVAELCQAQEKLGLAMPALPSKKLGSSSI